MEQSIQIDRLTDRLTRLEVKRINALKSIDSGYLYNHQIWKLQEEIKLLNIFIIICKETIESQKGSEKIFMPQSILDDLDKISR